MVTLGGEPAFHAARLTPQAADALAGEAAERGRTPVLVIDEAHLLDHPQLEAIRMLNTRSAPSVTTEGVAQHPTPSRVTRSCLGA